MIEKAGVDADIARYSSLFSVWRNQRYANESEVAHLPMRTEGSLKLLKALTSDATRQPGCSRREIWWPGSTVGRIAIRKALAMPCER